MMENITILDMQSLVLGGKILWTEHMALRMRDRSIKRTDVITCLINGEIIEQYPDDTPYPSCLILGVSANGKAMHIVCS